MHAIQPSSPVGSDQVITNITSPAAHESDTVIATELYVLVRLLVAGCQRETRPALLSKFKISDCQCDVTPAQ
jgi:hypothetical protein